MKRILAVIISLLVLTTVGCSDDNRQAEPENKTTVAGKGAQNNASPSPSVGTAAQKSQGGKIFLTITPQEAKKMMETRKDLMVIDLREANELREGYIEGSQLIPMSALAKGTKTLPNDKPLLLVCAVGGRSYGVGQYFSVRGYPEVYNLRGGISAWKRAGFPLKK